MGYAIVTPNYSLAGSNSSPFPHCIHDGFDAIQWVYDHKERYNLDSNNLGVFGESAGAHIAMMVAYSNVDSLVIPTKYVIDIYGPSNLYRLSKTSTIDSLSAIIEKIPSTIIKDKLDIIQYLYGFDPKLDTLKAKYFADQNSPIFNLSSLAPPTLVIHGKEDQIVPINQSMELISTFEALQVYHEEHFLTGVDHAFIGATSLQKDSVQHWIYDFIVKYYDANNSNTKAPTTIQNL